MTPDGFITFLGLIAAALAIVSPVTRLQLVMAARPLTFWSILFTAAVLYLEFFDLLAPTCPSFLGAACPVLSTKGSVTPQLAAFAIVFVWLVILGRMLLHPKVSLRSLPVLERLVIRLEESGRFSDLVDVVENPIGFIDDCATGNLPFQLRRARLAGLPKVAWQGLDPDLVEEENPPTKFQRVRFFWSAIKRDYAALLPSDAAARSAAERILQTVLRSGPVVEWIAQHRPRFGARLLSLRSYKAGDFSEQYLTWLIAHPGSAFYDEIRDNRNLDRCGYVLASHNAILCALLADARVAERLEAYRPIGEHAISALSPNNMPEYVASLQLPTDIHWTENGCWNDPTFVAIRFFDIMVRAAACQNINWHMWLYYLPTVVEKLEASYLSYGGDEPYSEYPTRAGRLLYAAFEALAAAVSVATEVDAGSRHRAPENDRLIHENGNIPKSAALALGICLRIVLLSDRIEDDVQSNLLEETLSPLRDGRMRVGHDRLRKVLIDSIIKGGIVGGGQPYLLRLWEFYAGIDKPWHNDLDDFRAALKRATEGE